MMQGLQDLGVIQASKQELLMTSVPPLENVNITNIRGIFQGNTPLRTKAFESWPTHVNLDCLHCGSSVLGTPIPAIKFFETQLNVFWVQGPFCSGPCALGYISEHESSSASKQLALTIHVLRTYFKMTEIHIAPPRSAHSRQGGPLSDKDFRGIASAGIREVLEPPFVSFAHYVIANRGTLKMSELSESSRELEAFPQSSGKFIDLVRPEKREFNLLERKPTMRAPQILNFLAQAAPMLLTKTSTSNTKTSEENLIENTRPAKASRKEERPSDHGFLTRQMKKETELK